MLRSILSVPLREKRSVIGALQVVDTAVGRFDEAHRTDITSMNCQSHQTGQDHKRDCRHHVYFLPKGRHPPDEYSDQVGYWTKKSEFTYPQIIAEEKKPRKISTRSAAAGQSVTTTLSGVLAARSVTTPSGEFAYIRIFTFNVNDPEVFIDEFIRLAELLPKEGLIVDVRGNGGGHILGVDANTGAGGANVWTHDWLRLLLQFPAPEDPDTPYKALPNGASMRVAIRRTLRVGEQSGTPLEDLGITPDSPYALTKDDLLNANRDLINAAGKILKDMPVRLLTVTTSQAGSTITILATTLGLSRLDIYIDGRPRESLDINDGDHSLVVALPAGSALLKLDGYKNDELVASRKLKI